MPKRPMELNKDDRLLEIIKRLERENKELKEENERLRRDNIKTEPIIPISLPDPELLIKQENFFYKEIIKELCKESNLRIRNSNLN